MAVQKSASHYDHYSEIDVICPTAVEPGTFFTCQLYVLDEEFVKAEIADNITGTTEDETGWIRVPSEYYRERCHYILSALVSHAL